MYGIEYNSGIHYFGAWNSNSADGTDTEAKRTLHVVELNFEINNEQNMMNKIN